MRQAMALAGAVVRGRCTVSSEAQKAIFGVMSAHNLGTSLYESQEGFFFLAVAERIIQEGG